MKKLIVLLLLFTCTLIACSHVQFDQEVYDVVDTKDTSSEVSKEIEGITEDGVIDEELTVNTNNPDVLTWKHIDYSNGYKIQFYFVLNEVTRDFILNVNNSDEGQNYKYTGKIDVEIFNEVHSALITAINDNEVNFDQSWFTQFKNLFGNFIWEVCKNDGYDGVYVDVNDANWSASYADIDTDMNGELTYKEIFTNIYTWVNN